MRKQTLLLAICVSPRARNRRARSYYFATLQLDPVHERAYKNFGVLALQDKCWSAAAEFLSKALEQNPEDAKTYYLIAQAKLHAHDFQKAGLAIAHAMKARSGRVSIPRFKRGDPTRPDQRVTVITSQPDNPDGSAPKLLERRR